jgi:molybdenum cofactor cytidylyltransferase
MITAIVLAAGLSKRMGKPKMLLPWGGKRVIEQVVDTLSHSGISEIIVVAGEFLMEMENLLANRNAKVVKNPYYSNGEMTASLQAGLSVLSGETTEVMVVLGDQPFLEETIVSNLMKTSQATTQSIVMPSVNHKRGHPWIIKKVLLQEIMEIRPPSTLRDFIRKHDAEIEYLVVTEDNVIRDMDTPEDYERLKPKAAGD